MLIPRAFEVEIDHSGDWPDDEDAMRERGIIISEVQPISDEAARVLAAQRART